MSDKAESLSPAAGRGMEPKIEFTLDTYEQCMAKPYRMLPPEVRPAVLEFRLFFQRFFPDPMEICFMFAAWMRDDGLTAEEAVAVMRDARRPVNVGKFKFASDLTTHVAESIEKRRVQRRKAEDIAREAQRRAEYQATYDREQAERRAKAEAAGQPKVTQLPATAADFYRPQTAADVTPAKPAHDSAAANAAFLDAVRSGKAPPAAKVSA